MEYADMSARVVFALLIALVAAPGSAQAVSFAGLGDLPGGNISSAAWGVSANGKVVVGGTGFTGGAYRDNVFESSTMAFRWTRADGMTAVSPFGARQALAVSSDASVIVGQIGSSAAYPYGFRSPALDGNPSHDYLGWPNPPLVRVGGVSGDGRVVIGFSLHSLVTTAPAQRAFRWTAEGGFLSLGVVPGLGLIGSNEAPNAISADGSVIVGARWSSSAGGGLHAFRWTESTGMTLLPGLPASGSSVEARAISADGTIIAGYASDGAVRRPVRWLDAGSIEVLEGGEVISEGYATAISPDGSTILGAGRFPGDPSFEPFIWDQQNGLRRLDALLVSLGGNLDGWNLLEATGVSADGMTITGNGINPLGRTEGWIATIPEPSVLLLLSATSTLLTGRRRGAFVLFCFRPRLSYRMAFRIHRCRRGRDGATVRRARVNLASKCPVLATARSYRLGTLGMP